MIRLDLDSAAHRDKLLGCWLGKNAGGTLGGPLETGFGQAEPFDVWWYPELREGGIPNDDLELQLIWLKALEEVGPGLTSLDLARYWLDHIAYNWDEYGMIKANLRLGLEPPLSGSFDNWFADSMGCPIRSEIWACVAPGKPRIAARYAYLDAVCDHAGGEGVYGELFNAALEAAAFVVDDPNELIDIGLSYIPSSSRTASAIRAVVDGHATGLDWKQARLRVLEAAPHYSGQYAPINLGFQAIGLLYGRDFGEGICITVNCGFDTDSSGASVGSYLGIIQGAAALPSKWIEPLGTTIATHASVGGIINVESGPNPIPTNLDDLIARVLPVSRRVLAWNDALALDGSVQVVRAELYADDEIRALRDQSPNRIVHVGLDLDTAVQYAGDPVVEAGTPVTVSTELTNRRTHPISGLATLDVPAGWDHVPAQQFDLDAFGSQTLAWTLGAPDRARVANSNVATLHLRPAGRPPERSTAIVLAGARAFRACGPFPAEGADPAVLLETALPPETLSGPATRIDARPGEWRDVVSHGNAVPLEGVLSNGILYLQTWVHAESPENAWLSVDASCALAFWINGELVAQHTTPRRIRPALWGQENAAGAVALRAGWNELLVKLVSVDEEQAPECHISFATPPAPDGSSDAAIYAAMTHLGRTRFPWDE